MDDDAALDAATLADEEGEELDSDARERMVRARLGYRARLMREWDADAVAMPEARQEFWWR